MAEINTKARLRGELAARKREIAQLRAQLAAQNLANIKSIIDNAPVAILICDAEARVTLANQLADNLFGKSIPYGLDYSSQAHMRLYQPDGAAYDPRDLPMTRSALDGETLVGVDMFTRGPGGAERYLRVHSKPVGDQRGRRVGAVCAFEDITEDKRLEAEREAMLRSLRESEAQKQQLIDELEEQAAELEVQTEELSAQAEEARAQNEQLSQLTEQLQVALEQEVTAQRQVGAEREAARAAQIAAESLAAQQSAILDAIADGLVVYDNEGRILRMNSAAETLLGYSSEAQTMPIEQRAMSVVHPLKADGTPYIAPEFPARRAMAGETVCNEEMILRVPARSGGDLQLSVSAAPVQGPNGNVDGAVITFKDVSELHHLNAELRVQAQELRRAAEMLERRVADRTAGLQILHEIDKSILTARKPEEIAQAAIDRIVPIMGATRATVGLLDFDAETVEVLAVSGLALEDSPAGSRAPFAAAWNVDDVRAGRITTIEDILELPDSDPLKEPRLRQGMRSVTFIPMMADEVVIGAMTIARAEQGSLPPDWLALATQVADSLAIAIHNSRLNQQLQESQLQLQAYSRRLVEAVENERQTLARELHDEAGQALTALKIGLGLCEKDAACAEPVAERLGELKQLADHVLEDLRRIAASLRPGSLDRAGLVPAVRQYIEMFERQTGLDVQFLATGFEELRLPPETETNLFRLVQESLTNVARHANAMSAGVILQRSHGRAVLIIEDDGQGFDVKEALLRGRLGLVGMRERAEMLGGTFTIETKPGSGTSIIVEVPCDC